MFISVIIPLYNKEKFIKNCILSIVNQDYKNIEIICVDDGSTDKSCLIVKKLSKKIKNIKLIKIKHSGVSTARNIGLKCAIGDYVHFVDADDCLKQNSYKIIAKIIEKFNSDIDLITFFYEYIKLKSKITNTLHRSQMYEMYFNNNETPLSNYMEKPQFYLTWGAGGANLHNKLFKKQIINKFNLELNQNLSFGEDADFYYRYLFYCKKIISLPYDFYCYRLVSEVSYTTQLLNHIEVFKNEFIIYDNSFKFYENKSSIIGYYFLLGFFHIIFTAYKNINNHATRLEAAMFLKKFIKNNTLNVCFARALKKYDNDLNLINYNLSSLISNNNNIPILKNNTLICLIIKKIRHIFKK